MSPKISPKKTSTGTLILAMAILVVAALVLSSGCGCVFPPEQPSDKTSEDVVRKIDYLIYPTLGYPQIVASGQSFTFEFDFTQDDPSRPQPASVQSWHASITATQGPSPYHADLDILASEKGQSSRWPSGSGRQVYEVYKVTAAVPEGVPADLYDLEVKARADGSEISDSQPNSISVVSRITGDYKVVQLTDIHVFDVEYPTSCPHDRGLHDAIYLRKAIDQINLIHPDFVIFSGDLIFGQKYMPSDWPPDDQHGRSSEYEYEYLWAYNAISSLDVPCFMIMGNHDGYNDGLKDGYEWWTESFGPLYYSFDYGSDHYTMVDTMDWTAQDRSLQTGLFYFIAQVLQPNRWQGQVRSGGDAFGAGQAPDPADYSGQLAWIRDDLAGSRRSGLRIVACHHDPAEVSSWDDADYWGYRIGGRGEGRLALQRLFADNEVNLVLSGHEHHDYVTEIAWSRGGGSTVYANTTALEPRCDTTADFPGYRMVQVAGDKIVSYNYQSPKWSYPYYKGVVAGQPGDMGALYDPAIGIDFSNGGDWTKGASDVTCTLGNSLDAAFRDSRLEFFMPSLDGGARYRVSGIAGARVAQYPLPDGWVEVQVDFTLPAAATLQVEVKPG